MSSTRMVTCDGCGLTVRTADVKGTVPLPGTWARVRVYMRSGATGRLDICRTGDLCAACLPPWGRPEEVPSDAEHPPE